MSEIIFLKGMDAHGDQCLIPLDYVAWISRIDKNDTPDIFGTLDGEVYTCEGSWQQAAEVYLLGGDDDLTDGDIEEKRVLH